MAIQTTLSQVEALYIGYFGRAGEPNGVQYWINQLDSGSYTWANAAASFSVQPEAIAMYPYLAHPDLVNPASFVDQVYLNLFNRLPDAEGKTYWTKELLARGNDPQAVGQFILDVINGAFGPEGNPADAATITNKIEAGSYFTEALAAAGVGGTHVVDGKVVLNDDLKGPSKDAVKGVTDNPATVEASQAATNEFVETGLTGVTFDLTPELDHFVGTPRNDTVNAFTYNAKTGGDATTFTPHDSIDGGGGHNTFNIYTKVNSILLGGQNDEFPTGATVKNMQVVNIYNEGTYAGKFGDAAKFQGVEELWQHNKAADVTNLGASTIAGFKNTAQNLKVTASAEAASATVALDGVRGVGATKVFALNVSGNKLAETTVKGTIEKDASATLNFTVGKDIQDVKVDTDVKTTLNIVDTASAKKVTSVDASASKGGITFSNPSKHVATIKTGSGDDDITVKTETVKDKINAVVETGAGNDIVDINTTGTGTTTVTTGEGNDTVRLSTRSDGKLTVDLGAGNDTFMGALYVKGTDSIDGGEGVNTLFIQSIGAANAGAFKNFQLLDVAGRSTNFDLDLLAAKNDITEIISSGNFTDGINLLNIGEGVGYRAVKDSGPQLIKLTQKVAGELSITLDTDSTANAANTNTIKVEATNAKSLHVKFDADSAFVGLNKQTIELKGNNDVKAIDLVSGGKNATNHFDYETTKAVELTISGGSALDLTGSDAKSFKNIDASSFTGKLTASLDLLDPYGHISLGSGDAKIDFALGHSYNHLSVENYTLASKAGLTTFEGFDIFHATGVTVAADKVGAGYVLEHGLLKFEGAGPGDLAGAISLAADAAVATTKALVFEYDHDSYLFVKDAGADLGHNVIKLAGLTDVHGLHGNVGGDLYVY
ncbi:MAG TPA: DUF4214 domain-containing protein [Xanthobacteraceae bacterium]|nr:DUF4214 domain-containing protein [Xanthobacteraceae bacterium]